MQDDKSASEPISLRERLQREENASEKPIEAQKANSVYDFLYCDARRIASFLSQFETHGTPSQIRTTASAANTTSARKQGTGGAGVPGFAQGTALVENVIVSDAKDATEKSFDPFWDNAIKFLDYISDRRLLRRDIFSARMGQIVLHSGAVVILDSSIMKDMWDKPTFKKQFREGLERANAADLKKSPKGKDQDFNLVIDTIKQFPHVIQCHMYGNDAGTWSSLDDSSLVTKSSDILLKNGLSVAGIWNMVGILDAMPNYAYRSQDDGSQLDIDKMIQSSMGTPLAMMMAYIAPVARTFMGRPENYFGITPILIFREIETE